MSVHSMPVPRVVLPFILAAFVLALGLALLMAWGSGGMAHGATTRTVTSLSDSGAGTLRQAIFDSSGGDTIDFAVTGTIILNSGPLVIDKSLSIQGPGSGDLSISGNNAFRVIHVLAGSVSISGITIRDGNDSPGGGVSVTQGELDMSEVTVRDNSGGGVYVETDAGLTIADSTVSDNTGDGIIAQGTAEISNSLIARNEGGGIFASSPEVRVVSSTVADNTGVCGRGIEMDEFGLLVVDKSTVSGDHASAEGGGLCLYGPTEVTNSTISGNTSVRHGGGAYVNASGRMTMTFSTVANNSSDLQGEGIYNSGNGDPAIVGNSVVTDNSAPAGPNCAGNFEPPTSLDHNLIGDDSGCNYVPAAGDLVNVDPLLGPLKDNTGPTHTHALGAGSPAIDAGDDSVAPTTDQRGIARPQGAASDIGAFEFTTPCNGKAATIFGTSGADLITGAPADVIVAFGGDDIILGLGGHDTICGGPGEDYIDGGTGKDRLFGQGDDDLIRGVPGDDRAFGGTGHDMLKGNLGNDKLFGNAGEDVLDGGRGNDVLAGGPGDDVALGRAHDDTINCGGGTDYANGGTGTDTAVGCEATVNVP